MSQFCGKVALVTGGVGGIGRCMVKELIKNGVKGIVMADQNKEAGCKALKEIGDCKVDFIRTDVTQQKDYEAAFKHTKKKFGQVDIVVNNAGILSDRKWELQIDINSTAVVRGTLLGMQHMRKDKGGKGGIIVNTGSILGLKALAGCPVYTGSKHFVIGFSRAIGTSFFYDLTGVKVLTICPGVTETTLISNTDNYGLEMFEGASELLLDQLTKKHPVQSADHIGKGLIYIINEGENGSTWVVEDSKTPYEQKPQTPTFI